LNEVSSQSERVLEAIATARRTDPAVAGEALEQVLGIVGTRDDVTLTFFEAFCNLPGNDEWAETFQDFLGYLAAREGRVWHGNTIRYELWYEEEFKAFARCCRRSLAERQRILSECRDSVKRIHDLAGYGILVEQDFKPLGDELRRRAHVILRDRFYLEGDWRGETPLPDGGRP
jgi:hypothetical protein